MSLPTALNVDINEIKDFRKTLISFYPEEISRTYKPNDRIRVNFPKGLLDLSSFNIFFDAQGSFYRLVSNSGLFYSLNYHFPKHTSSLIQSLRVFINDQEVSNIDEFNTIYNILFDIENDKINNNGLDNQNPEFKTLSIDSYNYDTSFNVAYSTKITAPIISNGWFRYAAQPTKAFTESFGISEWIGFFRDIKYINTFNIDLSIEIELASPYIMFYQTTSAGNQRRSANDTQIIDGADPDYTIFNVKANIHKLDFEGAPNMINNNLTFTDYVSRKGQKLTVDKNQKLTMNVKAECIKKLIATFLNNTRDTVAENFQSNNSGLSTEYERLIQQDASTRLGTSAYFARLGKGINTVSFYIDDIPINNNPMTMIEIERETRHAFNIKKTLWNNIYEFQNDFFSAVMSLEDHVKTKDGIVKSGYNTNGRNAKIMFESQAFGVPANTLNAADFIGTPILFVETERTIMIDNNNISIS